MPPDGGRGAVLPDPRSGRGAGAGGRSGPADQVLPGGRRIGSGSSIDAARGRRTDRPDHVDVRLVDLDRRGAAVLPGPRALRQPTRPLTRRSGRPGRAGLRGRRGRHPADRGRVALRDRSAMTARGHGLRRRGACALLRRQPLDGGAVATLLEVERSGRRRTTRRSTAPRRAVALIELRPRRASEPQPARSSTADRQRRWAPRARPRRRGFRAAAVAARATSGSSSDVGGARAELDPTDPTGSGREPSPARGRHRRRGRASSSRPSARRRTFPLAVRGSDSTSSTRLRGRRRRGASP